MAHPVRYNSETGECTDYLTPAIEAWRKFQAIPRTDRAAKQAARKEWNRAAAALNAAEQRWLADNLPE